MGKRLGMAVAVGAPTLMWLVVACVGDSTNPTPGNDAGVDSSPPTDSGLDTSAVNDASDAAAPACDLTKPFGKPVPVAGAINSPASDLGVWFLPDLLTVFVTTNRGDGGSAYSIYSGGRANVGAQFGSLSPVASLNAVSAGAGSQGPVLTADGLTVYFLTGTGGNYDTWTATRATTTVDFGAPALVAAPVNVNGGGAGEDYPTWISPDGSTLYFVSDRSGSAGRDVYTATRAGNGPFNTPVPLASVNSSGNDQGIVLTPDELQAFVTRGTIFYTSRSKKTDGFATPQAIAELSGLGAAPSFVSADGCTLYFDTSALDAGVGAYDVYSATRGK